MRNFSIFIILLLCGCSTVVSNENLAVNLIDKCFSVEKPIQVYASNNLHVAVTKQNTSRLHRFEQNYKRVKTLNAGDIIKISTLMDHSYGSAGRCWMVFAKNMHLTGIEFQLPSCWMDHNSIWFTPNSPAKLNESDKIELVTDYIKPSKVCI